MLRNTIYKTKNQTCQSHSLMLKWLLTSSHLFYIFEIQNKSYKRSEFHVIYLILLWGNYKQSSIAIENNGKKQIIFEYKNTHIYWSAREVRHGNSPKKKLLVLSNYGSSTSSTQNHNQGPNSPSMQCSKAILQFQ